MTTMAMTEFEYTERLGVIKAICTKVKEAPSFTEEEKTLIRVSLVDYMISQIESDEGGGSDQGAKLPAVG